MMERVITTAANIKGLSSHVDSLAVCACSGTRDLTALLVRRGSGGTLRVSVNVCGDSQGPSPS